MKNFINKINKITLSPLFFWVIINIALAPKVFAAPNEGGLVNPLSSDTFEALITNIANIMMKIGIPIAGIFIIYSGLKFVTARGNEQKLAEAKKTFYWTIIGAGILLGAVVIAEAIKATVSGL